MVIVPTIPIEISLSLSNVSYFIVYNLDYFFHILNKNKFNFFFVSCLNDFLLAPIFEKQETIL